MLNRTFISTIGIILLLSTATTGLAATRTWDGGGGDNYANTSANWSDNTTPVAGDNVIFDSTSSKNCIWNLPFDTNFGSMTIHDTYGGIFILFSSAINLSELIVDAGETFKFLTTATLNISGNVTLNGVIEFSDTDIQPTLTIDVGGNMTIAASTGAINSPAFYITCSNPYHSGLIYITVDGTLTVNGGIVGYGSDSEDCDGCPESAGRPGIIDITTGEMAGNGQLRTYGYSECGLPQDGVLTVSCTTKTWTGASTPAGDWTDCPMASTPVSLDAVTYKTPSVGGSRVASWKHTVGSNSNRYLFVTVNIKGTSVVKKVTYGSQELTYLKAASNDAVRTEIWGIASPASGNATVSVQLNSIAKVTATAVSVYDAGTPTLATCTTGNSTSPSVSITSTSASNMAFDSVATYGSAISATVGGSQTQVSNQITKASSGGVLGLVSRRSVSGTNNYTWTLNTAKQWVSCGINFPNL